VTYVIFEVKAENIGKINTLLKDDLIGRQSISTRDANSLDIKEDVSYVKIEGSDEGVKRAIELAEELEFKKIDDKKAQEINEKIKEQEDSAASGMGMIFD
jgi:flagellar hook assembly protein FlgD